jgi:lipoprotein-anchoring transpeptidase ErfK/SrfK
MARELPESVRFVALLPPNLACKNNVLFGACWGIGVRVRIARFGIASVVAALTVAASIGAAAAQGYYQPPPPGYYPPPPADYYPEEGYYPPPPTYYGRGPVPPADVGAAGPPYNSGYEASQASPYPPDDPRPYGAPPDRSAAWSAPADAPRPPGSVSGGSGDVTGSIHPAPTNRSAVAGLPPEDQPEGGSAADLPRQFQRQLVDYVTSEPAGTIIIDTPHTYLYLVLGPGKALRYGVGVGREGFTWSGTERVSHMSEWPDWHPPKEMIERQPYLPRFMAGGEGNPLGARALYLGNTIYRIHGTNQPSTIGHFVSSGCIRLTNEDITDLYSRVNVGTRVVVLPGSPSVSASAQSPVAR